MWDSGRFKWNFQFELFDKNVKWLQHKLAVVLTLSCSYRKGSPSPNRPFSAMPNLSVLSAILFLNIFIVYYFHDG